MDKIIQTMQKLYSGENVAKKHWLYVAIGILPAIMLAIMNAVDKDQPKFIIPLFILTLVFFILSIPSLLTMSGASLNFINKKFHNGISEFPLVNFDCLKKGFKALPFVLVWFLYGTILTTAFVGIIVGLFVASGVFTGNSSGLNIVLLILLAILATILLMAFLFIYSPFVTLLWIEYSKDFQLKGKYFNLIVPFQYMQKHFKPVIITALKYYVVSFVVNLASNIVLGIISFVSAFTIVLAIPKNELIQLIVIIIIGSITTLVSFYLSTIVSYSYVENLVDVYKENYLTE